LFSVFILPISRIGTLSSSSTLFDILLFLFFEIEHIHQTLYRQWCLWYACC